MNVILKRIPTESLEAGMVLGETIYDHVGNVLLSKGIELRHVYIEKISLLNLDTVLVSDISKYIFEEPTLSVVDPVLSMVNRDIIVAETRSDASMLVRQFMDGLGGAAGTPNIDKFLLIVNQIIDEILKNDEIAFNLGELKSVDDYTFEHSVNVCVLALLSGISLGLKKVSLVELGIGAILHDIGKILIPQEVLNKPGLLDDEEFDMVKRHARLGYDVLNRIKGVSQASAAVAMHHHERYDGNGYPDALKNEAIPLYSRIVAIADVFDALTSDRVYSRKISPYKAMEYVISMVGAHFDQEIVKRFTRQLGFFYKGLHLELNTGETAVVVMPQIARPLVRVLRDFQGMDIKDHYEIDMLKNPGIQIRNVICPEEFLEMHGISGCTS